MLLALTGASSCWSLAVTGFGGLLGFMLPLFFVVSAAGLSFPNAPAIALNRHGESGRHRGGPARRRPVHDRRLRRAAGRALDNGTAVPMAAIMVGTTGLAAGAVLVRPRRLLNTAVSLTLSVTRCWRVRRAAFQRSRAGTPFSSPRIEIVPVSSGKCTPQRSSKPEPAHGERAQGVAVAEADGPLHTGAPDPVDDPVQPLGHLVGRLAAGRRVGPDRPAGIGLVDSSLVRPS